MSPKEMLGCRVRVLGWDGLDDVFPTDPSGTITHVADFGGGRMELTVRVEGFPRGFVFGLDEVEVLPATRIDDGLPVARSG